MGIIKKTNSEMNKILIALLFATVVFASTIEEEPAFVQM